MFCQEQGQSVVPSLQHFSFLSCRCSGGGRQEPGNISIRNLSSWGTQLATSIKRISTSSVELLLLCCLFQENPTNPTANQIPASGKIGEKIIRSVSKESGETATVSWHGMDCQSVLSGIKRGNHGQLSRSALKSSEWSLRVLWKESSRHTPIQSEIPKHQCLLCYSNFRSPS